MADYVQKLTGAAPVRVSGHIFRCWRIRIDGTEWRTDDERLWVSWNGEHRNSYSGGYIDQQQRRMAVGRLYRSRLGAMKAVIKAFATSIKAPPE